MKFVVLLLGFLIVPRLAQAQCDHVVSTSGSDTNPGTLSAPWRTPRFGAASISSGQTLCIRGGTYTGVAAQLDTQESTIPNGTAERPTVIRAYPGERVVLAPGNRNGMRFTSGNPSDITVQDVTLDMAGSTSPEGIYSNAGQRLVFERVRVVNGCGNGVAFGGTATGHVFRDGEVSDICIGGQPNQAYGFYLTSGGHVIEGSRISNICGFGIHLYDTQGDALDDLIVRRNTITNTGRCGGSNAAILHARGQRVQILNNIIRSNRGGISLYTNSDSAVVDGNLIEDNLGDAIALQYYVGQPVLTNNRVERNGQSIVDYQPVSAALCEGNVLSSAPVGLSCTAPVPVVNRCTAVSAPTKYAKPPLWKNTLRCDMPVQKDQKVTIQ